MDEYILHKEINPKKFITTFYFLNRLERYIYIDDIGYS